MINYFNSKLMTIIKGKHTKLEIINKLVELVDNNTNLIVDKKGFSKNLHEREKIGSTCIGMGIAIPHARCEGLKDLVIAIGLLEEPALYDSLDSEPIKIVVLVGAPKEKSSEYLVLLSQLAKIFRSKNNREIIKSARNQKELIESIMEIED
ncbi:MAG: PTS sugar transporter subunit IIA [Fusobacterium sp. JB021]|nr:PTS sugar transporter subunit IIA [Fusobacterium sp. JB020]MDP0493458.1 PTS sugar transporter subunit IIA [Fusobacterium sp. JB021]MDP0507085.1 PTS sugar transporter subunit IIA [Fusobacterium sp. JB019]